MVFPSVFFRFLVCGWLWSVRWQEEWLSHLNLLIPCLPNSCFKAHNFAFKNTFYFTKQVISKTTNCLSARLAFNHIANSTHYDISSDENSFRLTCSQNCSLPPQPSVKNAVYFWSPFALDVIGTSIVTAQTTQHVFNLTSFPVFVIVLKKLTLKFEG